MDEGNMKWRHIQPVEILFERGGITQLVSLIQSKKYQRGILICDPYFKENGLAMEIMASADGFLVDVFSDITPNPKCSEVDACVQKIANNTIDFAVAVGGGSVIDCAKAACAVAASGGQDPVSAFHSEGKKLALKRFPLIAAPTTAGTGSEVTNVSVLTDTKKGIKAPIAHDSLYPAIALIDSKLTETMPPAVTAACGLDALSHAIEGFWSIHHQPICDAIALYAAQLVFEWLPKAYANGSDQIAREKMAEASVMAGTAFGLPKTAASHACSYPLTQVYGLPHGEACAFTLDSLCHINAQAQGGRLHKFARQIGFADAHDMGNTITAMKKTMQMRMTLEEAGIKPQDVPKLAKLCQHPNLANNPVSLSQADLESLFLSKTK